MTDAYIYVRYSTPRQEFTLSGDKSSSEERQIEACRAFIKRMGWNEVGVIKDLGRSAWRGDHLKKGNLGKFVKRIHDHEIPAGTVVVAENIDRFSRQEARVTQRWIEDICDAGIQIAHVAGNKVYNAENLRENLFSILEILFLAEGAFRYVENLKTRVKASYDSRLEKARIDNTAISGIGPAWLEKVGKRPNIKWEPIAERVVLINEIFDMTVAGKPPWTIARELNERPNCPSFGGRKWDRTYIVKLVRSPAIEGDYVVGEGKHQRPTGEVLRGYYGDPVVPLDVVAQARAMMDRRRRGSGRNSGAINNLFGQKIRCGHCRGRMMQVGYQSRYLTCYEAARGSGCDNHTTYKYRPFEASALDTILHLALDETFFRQAEKSNLIGLEIAGREKAIRDKTAEAARAYDMWDRTQSPTAESRMHEAEAEIVKLNAKLADLKAMHADAKGAADADAHLQRVHGVREALSHPDDDVRLPARLRVSEALQGLVDFVDCYINDDDGSKDFHMELIGGAYVLEFDNEGHIDFCVVPDVRATAEEIMFTSDPPELQKRIADFVRRRQAS